MSETLSTTARRRQFWRRAALAPTCLLLVAGLQVWRVQASGQSAWKGGGFGMFSTVDTPNARFVRLYVTTTEGKRAPIAPPAGMSKLVSELRTTPTEARAGEFARSLVEQAYMPEDYAQCKLAREITNQALAGCEAKLVVATAADKQRYPEAIVAPAAVDVEVWRYTYDRRAQRVIATPITNHHVEP